MTDISQARAVAKPKCLYKTTLTGQPSCIAFSAEHVKLFVIGTYQLEESKVNASNSFDEDKIPPDQGHQKRSGTVQLFRLEHDSTVTSLQSHQLDLSTHQPAGDNRTAGAVLDLRFCPVEGFRDILAVCTSTGLIIIFRLVVPSGLIGTAHLDLIHALPLFEAEILVTSLSWRDFSSKSVPNEGEQALTVTLSDGRVAVVKVELPRQGSDSPSIKAEIKAEVAWIEALHQESAWISKWLPDYTSSTNSSIDETILTGGDDAVIHQITLPLTPTTAESKLKHSNNSDPSKISGDISEGKSSQDDDEEKALHSIDKSPFNNPHPTVNHAYDDKTHSAGVTAILPLPVPDMQQSDRHVQQHVLLTGSYDNTLRIMNVNPSARRWKVLAEMDLTGGVWKIDLLAQRQRQRQRRQTTRSNATTTIEWLILVSCMHAGVRVVVVSHHPDDGDTGEGARAGRWEIDVLYTFEEHDSMCYASAASAVAISPAVAVGSGQVGSDDTTTFTAGESLSHSDSTSSPSTRSPSTSHSPMETDWMVVSTSFYDCRLCVWGFEWLDLDD